MFAPRSKDTFAPNDIILRGTLDLLILKTLSLEPMHGWAVSQRLQQLSKEALRVGQGSLYPALQRMEEKGWVESEWRATEENRQAKYLRPDQERPARARGRGGSLAELRRHGRVDPPYHLTKGGSRWA